MDKIDFFAIDNVALTGFLFKSREKTENIILSVHGMGTNCLQKREEMIANKSLENNIDFFCFDNRGSELAKYLRINENKVMGGTSYENVIQGYEDIIGAILKLKQLGYKNIFLQGHSLGSTKIVYTYNRLLQENSELIDNIKGIILISLIDLPKAFKMYMRDKYVSYMEYAFEKEKNSLEYELMPIKSFVHPLSVKTFLKYTRDNKDIDFANYGFDNELDILNKIKIPLFMRWGNKNEFILQQANELVEMLNKQIENNTKDINYIDGADHSYTNTEEVLANEINEFIKMIIKTSYC